MATTLGVLVAGGAGSRLASGEPKPLVRLGGMTLVERALRALAGPCDDIVVAAPAGRVPAWPDGIRTARAATVPRGVADAPGPAGPLAGMVAGLTSCPYERAIVLGVDFPFMDPGMLSALLDGLGNHHAVVPAPGGIAQPLAAAYAPAAVAILAARLAAGEGAPSRALVALRVLRLDDAALARMPGGLDCFFNLNTPADLAEAERRMAARAENR